MPFTKFDPEFAHRLDEQDELAAFRNEFIIDEANLIYLDGNSLGRLPKRTFAVMQQAINQEWGQRLIRGWQEGWMEMPTKLGAKLAQLVGAQADEIIVTESTSTNLFKLATAALRARPRRNRVISDVFNFPSDLYMLQGIIDLLGKGHYLDLAVSNDETTIETEAICDLIDPATALVALTHVSYRNAFMHDLAHITEKAHQVGALVLWDLSHSAGAVPIDLNGCAVDLAVGCTYKFLNSGPGAPAFLYVRRDLQDQLYQPLWGWLGSKNPFAFNLEYTPADDIVQFQVGTPPILAMQTIGPALDLIAEAGIDRLRAKSVQQSEYLIALAEQWLTPFGVTIGSPRQATQRGSHVSLRHPESYRINMALINPPPPDLKVIPDFREPDHIRFGITPLYTTFSEIYQAMSRLRTILAERLYEGYSTERLEVT